MEHFLPVIHLRLFPWLAFHAPDPRRLLLFELFDKALNARVAALKTALHLQILIDPLGAQSQIQLLFDPLPIRFAVTRPTHFPGPRNGTLWIRQLIGIALYSAPMHAQFPGDPTLGAARLQ